jgi:hypothetical protein
MIEEPQGYNVLLYQPNPVPGVVDTPTYFNKFAESCCRLREQKLSSVTGNHGFLGGYTDKALGRYNNGR